MDGGNSGDQFVLMGVLCMSLLRVVISLDGEIIFCYVGNMWLVDNYGALGIRSGLCKSSFGRKM